MREVYKSLIGKTFTDVDLIDDEEITFEATDGMQYVLKHERDCCEVVGLKQVDGDLEHLKNSPILMFEKVTEQEDEMSDFDDECRIGSNTWTFIKMATLKGYVTVSFFGTSNGYYSEDANMYFKDEYGDWAHLSYEEYRMALEDK